MTDILRTPDGSADLPSKAVEVTDPNRATEMVVFDAEPVEPSGEEDQEPLAKSEMARRRKGQALNSEELRMMLVLHQKGVSQWDIAKQLNCNQSCISRNLMIWQDTKIEARAHLDRSARKLAEKLVDTADNEQILEILDRTDVLAKKRTVDESSRVNVMIGIALPKAGS